jgi:CBS domain-containing protein
MHEVAEFLRSFPPFDTLGDGALAAVAAATEIEFQAAGTVVLGPDGGPSEFAWVVRRGSVELLEDGRLLDLLGEGELFGYVSMLLESPAGFTARASEDTLLYRMPEATILPVLERPDAIRFLVGSITAGGRLLSHRRPPPLPEPSGRPVRELLRSPALVCPPELPVGQAAARMAERGATCVMVEVGDTLGIVTDHDLRTRVLATGAGPGTPLRAVMTAPAHTVGDDRLGSEALLEMLDYGVRHLPVLDARRRLVGVLDDVDLMASERRAPFRLRSGIERGPDPAAEVAAGLPATVVDLYDARTPALTISRVISAIHDTLVRRLIELAQAELGPAPAPYAWLATGSFGRREPFPGSDSDSALAWDGTEEPAAREWMRALAERVIASVAASGIRPCPEGAVASSTLFARPISGWERAVEGWLEDPDRDRGLTLLSVVVESAPVWGATALGGRLAGAFARARTREETLRRLAVAALALRPPTGFLRDFVLEHSGERKGLLDIKRGGLMPVVALARWAALSAGVVAPSTTTRLEAAEAEEGLSPADAAVLRETFELACALRMEHQVERLRAGLPPDDLIDPSSLTPLTRRALKDAFRAVGRVQRGLAVGLGLSPR